MLPTATLLPPERKVKVHERAVLLARLASIRIRRHRLSTFSSAFQKFDFTINHVITPTERGVYVCRISKQPVRDPLNRFLLPCFSLFFFLLLPFFLPSFLPSFLLILFLFLLVPAFFWSDCHLKRIVWRQSRIFTPVYVD